MNRTVILKSEQDTINLAKEFAEFVKHGAILALYGELGAGKTFFTQHLCKYLGVTENVSSPSYVLMNEYMGKFPIAHLDLYRLGATEEVLELGLEEMFEDCLTIIEWPELAEPLLPEKTIRIKFKLIGEVRQVEISGIKNTE